jgi:SAM-dependent methyltransferase
MTIDAHRSVLARYLVGKASAPLTLMHLLIHSPDVAEVETAVGAIAAAPAGPARERIASLHRLLADHRNGIAETARLLRRGIDHQGAALTGGQGLAACRALFDRLARELPEAAVALYSLGSPDLLRCFTDEIVDWLAQERLVSTRSRVLDLGCGIGRIAAALAPRVASIVGLDLSPEMIGQAYRRTSGLTNVTFVVGDGDSLAPLADRSIDVVLAVDSFPYIVQCGRDLASSHFAEAARVLRKGGDLVILNYSYRGIEVDRADVARLAPVHGFLVLRNGVACFKEWDGMAFHLQRSAQRAQGSVRPSARG